MSEIKFGTDGWRAVLNKDFTFENVLKTVNGIAYYVYSKSEYGQKIVIGYDPRNKADEFAFFIAEKLSEYGFDVEISDKIIATPVIAYTALNRNAYAIMITASHNPSEYLGIKFIPPYGGPAEDYMVKEITKNLENTFIRKREKRNYEVTSFEKEYLAHIKTLIDTEKIKNSDIKINYDGHHGAAAKLFKEILDELNIENITQNMERDINFGGFLPDPKEKYLPELKSLCTENGNIGLSNDGDGDRFGVFNEKGEFVSGNEIIALLMYHLKIRRNFSGKLAKTVGSSSMLNLYAEMNDVDVIETPVGFKWLGSAMRNDDVIIAGEESGGLSIKGHVPEKDGIVANLLIIEMLAYSGKKLYEMQSELKNSFSRDFINNRIDLKLDSKEEQQQIIDKFKELRNIDTFNIAKKNTIDGLKLIFDNENWILLRKSGTEPLLRIYFESDTKENLIKTENAVKNYCAELLKK